MTAMPALDPRVADVTLMRPDHNRPLMHLPDTATALVYRRIGAGEGDICVIGPRSHASYHQGKALALCIRVRLRAGTAGSVLGVPIDALRDDAMPLAGLWGDRAVRLESRLNELTDPGLMLRRFQDALQENASDDDVLPRHRIVHETVAALSTTGERFGALARRLSVSERRLRDLFTEQVGLSPKRFARIERVRKVLAGAEATDWAQLASDAGYYDQSHMTADFHTLMGTSPAAFRAGRLPEPTPCTTAIE